MARKQWRCFHCDEVFFSVKWAREHFGSDQGATPACKIKGHEGHLITYIRRLEDDLAKYRVEDSDVLRAMFSLEVDHQQALIREEEKGYERAVRDMRALDAIQQNFGETAVTKQTPIMEQAAKAAETVAKWSDAKKEYARRVIASGKSKEA